ncbi:hypothetical protein DSCA_36090 [Desulfosarcina alkanivorans]|jgi:hypothetical protein|uniref:Lipoprotein SmpA/OmlA domain-containing protein n=1 Tax=Desulfosarcina alkanivorans TaxID=571177 RepID=A0A5K7YP87_9BACT|nr:DUF2845 domain-containing protein [Desulfosarcina alkanivorans]BBO69679.1 hypothetical protein DSCA_36090 [Desulfosarcina alkanivorans]
MKKSLFIGLTFLVFLLIGNHVFGLTVGNEIVSVGDLKHEVLLKCGQPRSKEIIGYIDRVVSDERIRVMKIEEWIIAVTSYGKTYYYSLMFEGNELKEIKSAGEK